MRGRDFHGARPKCTKVGAKRCASGANDPRIRRPGSMVNRLGFAGNIGRPRRSPVSVFERIPGARARLSGARRKFAKFGEKAAPSARTGPESGGADQRPFALGAFRGCGGFDAHSDFVSRSGFVLAATRLLFVSLSFCGSRSVFCFGRPAVAVVSLVLVCVVRVWGNKFLTFGPNSSIYFRRIRNMDLNPIKS